MSSSSDQQKRKSSDHSGGAQKKQRSGDAQGSGGGASGSGQGGSQGGGQGGSQGGGRGGGQGRGRGGEQGRGRGGDQGRGRGRGRGDIPPDADDNSDTEYPQEAAHETVVREIGNCPVLCNQRPNDHLLTVEAIVHADDVGHNVIPYSLNIQYNVRMLAIMHIRTNAQNALPEIKRYMREVSATSVWLSLIGTLQR